MMAKSIQRCEFKLEYNKIPDAPCYSPRAPGTDQPMPIEVSLQTASVRTIAAVRRRIYIRQIASAWKPALDQVWEFLRRHPGLRTDGHNLFLYHHPANMESPMDVDFGVEVTRSFDRSGEVFAVETPAGEVASALHIGRYERLGETHAAIHAWAAANKISFAGKSWEIYGDWTEDPTKLETRIEYLVSAGSGQPLRA